MLSGWLVLAALVCARAWDSSWTRSLRLRPLADRQTGLMDSDMCIAVDEQDRVLGSVSKRDAHSVTAARPAGSLHRAFSVFLFNEDNQLLLQQRASSKLTFPNVWTNTCCSHPLFVESEMDSPESIAAGKVGGVITAAIRKLHDELGIPPSSLHGDQFKYLTRIQYFAPSGCGEWCEHEVDYMLLLRAPVSCTPNPDEAQAVRYVTQAELRTMMDPASGLLWSPWFRIVADRFLSLWWDDLSVTLDTDRFVDTDTIHRC